MKIAILFDANLNNRKGLFNAIINRAKNLMAMPKCSVELYCLQPRPGGLSKIFKQRERRNYENTIVVDGLCFNMMWYERYLIDSMLTNRLHRPPILFRRWMKKNCSTFSAFDLISAHSTRCGDMARVINKRYGIPFCVTWHGTDIHTNPFLSSSQMRYVKTILQSATCNFFVSKALMDVASSFSSGFRGEVLYNGVNERFFRFDDEIREKLKVKYGVEKSRVVAFVGNLIPIKNVNLLPLIFSEVSKQCSRSVTYWILGEGTQRAMVEAEMKNRNLHCVFWGNVPSSDMPSYMNCIDVLVLPSSNEGLPLVTTEAIACGANAVGSNRGGIPESIGVENTFDLNDDFVSNISKRILFLLENDVKQTVDKRFDWKSTAELEYSIYKRVYQGNEQYN